MVEILNASNINDIAIHSYIHQLKDTGAQSDIDEKQIIDQLMMLSQVYTFFDDLMRYHKNMNLADETIEKFVLDIDDLIDHFDEYSENKTSKNIFLDEYYKKANQFYNLLIQAQFELGFYLSDRKYQV